ncbi:hypothetical protein Pint_24038 [Pistacia integerrima]|uniref:Uncharacterized protein n=1 Tax=Pistacia integerrima TaxID=434235 RepID=A0ACC0YL05_9ROSI|nr:hypothetical protein Pint_24038 [Pistacia integerrima]
MDSTSLKTLNVITPLHTHFRSKVSLFRSLSITKFKHSFSSSSLRFSTLCSLPERENEVSLPHSVGQAVNNVSANKFLQVVLVSPQIPGNTGCIARTCAASAVGLHLVGPLGFQVDDTKLKCAGLDYWPYPNIYFICSSSLLVLLGGILFLSH